MTVLNFLNFSGLVWTDNLVRLSEHVRTTTKHSCLRPVMLAFQRLLNKDCHSCTFNPKAIQKTVYTTLVSPQSQLEP